MWRYRLTALAAVVLLVPACHRHDDDDRDVVLTVVNAGRSAVHVDVEYWDPWHGHYRTAVADVAAGDRWTIELHERWADVLIVRISDGAVLFQHELDWWDFHDDDETITVYP